MSNKLLLYIIILFFICSCNIKDHSNCIFKIDFNRSYDSPAPDVISIYITKSKIISSEIKMENINNIYFLSNDDTLEVRSHFKKHEYKNYLKINLLTTRYINTADTTLIKQKLLNQKIIFLTKDKKEYRFEYCGKR